MIAENEKDRQSETQSSEIFSQKTKDEISLLDSKIEKLMTAYLENALSLEEYRDTKSALVASKQLLKEKLSAFEKKSHNRFVSYSPGGGIINTGEPAKLVLESCITA